MLKQLLVQQIASASVQTSISIEMAINSLWEPFLAFAYEVDQPFQSAHKGFRLVGNPTPETDWLQVQHAKHYSKTPKNNCGLLIWLT